MDYSRVTPRARVGTTGINVERDLIAGEGVWINPPDRVAAITIAVHFTTEQAGSFTIETSCNYPDTIGEDGQGGYWDNVYGENAVLTENTVVMLANAVTGIRVKCISGAINVAFCG